MDRDSEEDKPIQSTWGSDNYMRYVGREEEDEGFHEEQMGEEEEYEDEGFYENLDIDHDHDEDLPPLHSSSLHTTVRYAGGGEEDVDYLFSGESSDQESCCGSSSTNEDEDDYENQMGKEEKDDDGTSARGRKNNRDLYNGWNLKIGIKYMDSDVEYEDHDKQRMGEEKDEDEDLAANGKYNMDDMDDDWSLDISLRCGENEEEEDSIKQATVEEDEDEDEIPAEEWECEGSKLPQASNYKTITRFRMMWNNLSMKISISTFVCSVVADDQCLFQRHFVVDLFFDELSLHIRIVL